MKRSDPNRRRILAPLTWALPAGIWGGDFLLALVLSPGTVGRDFVFVITVVKLLVLPWCLLEAIGLLRTPGISRRDRWHARAGAMVCAIPLLLLLCFFLYGFFLPKGEVPFWFRKH